MFRDDYRHQKQVLTELDEQIKAAIAGGGPRYQQRHRDRGRMLVRDTGRLGYQFPVGASVVTGIGVVSGVERMLIAHDPTVRGGATNPYSLKKTLRALEIARINRLPVINLVESGGADLPTQSELSVCRGCATMR